MTREAEIGLYMEKLGISYQEAAQLIEDDKDDFIGEEGEEMTKKAKVNATTERVQSKNTKKKTEKVRKVDEEKGYILRSINELISELGASNTALKTETELSFDYNGNKYTLKLTKHRPPKGDK